MDRNLGDELSALTLRIFSFSYRQGIPRDESEHGGGFVFDCRCLPNPGREERFARMTGMEEEVRAYLEASPEVHAFYKSALGLVTQAVSNYREREFNHLMVAFGCTGGRHRSVYMAERLAKDLRESGLHVFLCHTESDRWEPCQDSGKT